MAEELEIKLTLTPQALTQARQWFKARPGVDEQGSRQLVNRYYDTPESDLNRRKIALRVRQAGDRCIQTLKTQGEFVDGAHRRQEWEWPLTGAELDLGLLADTSLPKDTSLNRLVPVFETNFERTILMLEDKTAKVEGALDQGQVLAGDQSRALCELELELKQGDSAALLAWARQLAEQVPVFLNLISKAEQGYVLAGLHAPLPLAAESPLSTRMLHGLSRVWLTGSPDKDLEQVLVAMAEGDVVAPSLRLDLAWLRDLVVSGAGLSGLAEEDRLRLGRLQLALLA